MAEVFLITGGNIGDVEKAMEVAKQMIAMSVGEVLAESSLMRSKPWGCVQGEEGQEVDKFINQILQVETTLTPIELLDMVQQIENKLGRKRSQEEKCEGERTGDLAEHENKPQAMERVYHSRTIDIDILYYNNLVIDTERLTIPHPMIDKREFVLLPLNEIAPNKKHPITGESASEMLSKLAETEL